jgi:hypothetical protein
MQGEMFYDKMRYNLHEKRYQRRNVYQSQRERKKEGTKRTLLMVPS